MKPGFAKLLLVFYLMIVMGCTAAILRDGESSTAARNRAKSIHFVSNSVYKEECGSCHLAFLPGFLSTQSWTKLMSGLEDHFGEDASIDGAINQKIKKFLITHSANSAKASRRSKKIAMLEDGIPTLRITETVFWKRRHSSIKEYVWNREKVKTRANCEACHKDAGKGLYSEYDVHVPKD